MAVIYSYLSPPYGWRLEPVADPGGANPAMAPHRNWQLSLAPLRDRKSNGSIVILLKSKDFGSPRSDVLYRFGPPLWKNTIENTKKVVRNFWRYMWNFLGTKKFFREITKKRLLKNFVNNLAPPRF